LTFVIMSLFLLWFYIAQPTFDSYNSNQALQNKSAENHSVFASPNRLRAHVKKLSVEFSPRNYQQLENLEKAAKYIENEFSKTNAKLKSQSYIVKGYTYRNIMASFGPASKQVIVIGAHYDSAHNTPGADDNASGVAALLEIARLLDNQKLQTRIQLVAFTLEEPPFFRSKYMGSYVHASRARKNNINIKLMISLEMLGYYSENANSQTYPISFLKFIYSDKANFISIIGKFGQASHIRKFKKLLKRSTPMTVYSITAPPILKGVDFSDHLNYWKFDYPAIMISDTAFFRNKHYHQSTDTYEKLNYSKMSKVVRGIYLAIVKLSNN